MKLINLVDKNREISKEVKDKSSIGHKALDLISGIFAPVLSILTSLSILKGLLVIFVYSNYISTSSGAYQILHAVEDSALYFMPILIALTAAKKFGASEFIALTLGATLVYPGIINFVSKSVGIGFCGVPVKGINYSFAFIPIIIAVFILSKLEKFLNKVMNENLKLFLMPLICLIIMTPLTFTVIGSIATIITKAVGIGYIIPRFLNLPVYFGKGFEGLIISVVTSCILSAILSFITFEDPEANNNTKIDDNTKIEENIISDDNVNTERTIKTDIITSPLNGEFKELSQVSDKVFAEGALGK